MQKPQTLADLLGNIATLNDYIQAHSRELIGKAFAAFFDRCPSVVRIVWTQYAPYFNDGDPCVFSVHEAEVQGTAEIKDEDADEDSPYGYGERSMLPYRADNDTPEQAAVRVAWGELLAPLFDKAGERCMQAAFGDDALVIASRDGFDVQEYEHD